jgi:hypothetical protein
MRKATHNWTAMNERTVTRQKTSRPHVHAKQYLDSDQPFRRSSRSTSELLFILYSDASRRDWCASPGEVQVEAGSEVVKWSTTKRGMRQSIESSRRCEAKRFMNEAMRCRDTC